MVAGLLVGALGLVSCAAMGCGKASPRPGRSQLMRLLDEYEAIINRYTPVFERAKHDPAQFQRTFGAYSSEIVAWSGKWKRASSRIDPREVREARERLDRLNQRVSGFSR